MISGLGRNTVRKHGTPLYRDGVRVWAKWARRCVRGSATAHYGPLPHFGNGGGGAAATLITSPPRLSSFEAFSRKLPQRYTTSQLRKFMVCDLQHFKEELGKREGSRLREHSPLAHATYCHSVTHWLRIELQWVTPSGGFQDHQQFSDNQKGWSVAICQSMALA